MKHKYIFTTAFLVFFSFSVNAQLIRDGLIGYWPFTGNANDSSVNTNNGKVVGATLTNDRFGLQDAAYSFDGDGDYIDCGNDHSLLTSTNTTCFWFSYTDTSKIQMFVNNSNSNNGEWGAQYYHRDNVGLVAGVNAGSNEGWLAAVTTKNHRMADGKWHMWASTFYGKTGEFKLYLDGEFVTNTTARNNFTDGRDSLKHDKQNHWVFGVHSQYLSSTTNLGPRYMEGRLDDVMLFDRVLSSDEIMKLYKWDKTASIPDFTNLNTPQQFEIYPNPTNGVIHWKKKDATGQDQFTIVLTNALGQKVVSDHVEGFTGQLVLGDQVMPGMYILQVLDNKGVEVHRTRVVRR